MKSTGIVRKVDELGRVVLPMELRRTLDINVKDSVEIYVSGSNVVLKKFESSCIFCGSPAYSIIFCDKHVCENCAKQISSAKVASE